MLLFVVQATKARSQLMSVQLPGDIAWRTPGVRDYPTEMADEELLISASGFCCTESHYCFPRYVSAGLGDFIFQGVKF